MLLLLPCPHSPPPSFLPCLIPTALPLPPPLATHTCGLSVRGAKERKVSGRRSSEKGSWFMNSTSACSAAAASPGSSTTSFTSALLRCTNRPTARCGWGERGRGGEAGGQEGRGSVLLHTPNPPQREAVEGRRGEGGAAFLPSSPQPPPPPPRPPSPPPPPPPEGVHNGYDKRPPPPP